MTALPLEIASWSRNTRELIKVRLDEFRGRATIDVRSWFLTDDGARPGKGGLTVAVKHLPALADAISKALAEAQRLGLVDGGTA